MFARSRCAGLMIAILFLASVVHGQEPETPKFKAPELKAPAGKLPTVFAKTNPEDLDDLKAMQDHVAKVIEKVTPSVVCVRIGASFGSGVIVSKDGYVLTAGHVSGKPDRDVVVYLHNGKTVKGKTLGGNHGLDSGMIKITAPGDWPFAQMGDSAALEKGNWCMVIAHPGGFKTGRTPPVRLGRLLKNTSGALITDCVLVGGDSGGPLFDMHGRVVGINSRIGNSLAQNVHVPVNPYRDNWEKIAKSEVWGGKLGGGRFAKGGPYLGLQTDPKADACVVLKVTPGGPADKAGLKADDIIRKIDDKELTGPTRMSRFLFGRKVGDTVTLEIRRGEETLRLRVRIGKRP